MNSLAQSAQKQIEVAKLQRRISDKQSECDSIYAQIGRLYYSCRLSNTMPDDSINTLCDRMQALTEEIADMHAKIDELSDIVRCPACKSVVISGSTYCNKCGAKLPGTLFQSGAAEKTAPAGAETAAKDAPAGDADDAASDIEDMVDKTIDSVAGAVDGIIDEAVSAGGAIVEEVLDSVGQAAEDSFEEGAGEADTQAEAQTDDAPPADEPPEASDETVHGPEY